VPADHAWRLRPAAEAGAVERVRHRRHELARRVAWQLRVGVERDDVAHARQCRGVADDEAEALMPGISQQRVQVLQLASLALAAHPDTIGGVPAPRSVEQEEAVAAARFFACLVVAPVQGLDALARMGQQRLVAGQHLRGRVEEVRQQCEVQVRIAVGEEAHLERLGQRVDTLGARQHRRHHHQRARDARDAEREVHARQRPRPHHQRRKPVDDGHRKVARRNQRCRDGAGHDHPGAQRQCRQRPVHAVRGDRQQHQHEQQRRCEDGASEPGERAASHDDAHAAPERRAHPHSALEMRLPCVDEPVAHVRTMRRGRQRHRRFARQLHCSTRHLGLVGDATARDALNRMAVAVARGELHARIDIGRIVAKHLFDLGQGLDEFAPIH
jgi:hypothetical protein